ncbi:MAG: cytochrome class [Sphingobacteriales bacterium]|nr:cytochrome class [Sphingobacteriales bacterium]
MNTKQIHFTKFRGGIFAIIFLLFIVSALSWNKDGRIKSKKDGSTSIDWTAPSEKSIPRGEKGKIIRYGRELITHTSYYLGPKGKVAHLSNGMNCQNCHLNAGTKAFGLNYSAVASSYPKFQPRGGTIVSISGRINGCFQRSLNGQILDTASSEMLAMVAYMNWLGKDVTKGIKPSNNGVKKLSYLSRAANHDLGKTVFINKCQSCHGPNGLGILNKEKTEYIYPPLWGNNSYNDGAGLYRLSNFAGFVKNNMPYGTDYKHPQITDEMAWDVAAFVNSQPRPHKDQKNDWKDLNSKPIDFPFGPYADNYSEKQHKFGPFKPITEVKKLE